MQVWDARFIQECNNIVRAIGFKSMQDYCKFEMQVLYKNATKLSEIKSMQVL